MLLNILPNAELSIDLNKKLRGYLLSLKIKNKYFNYDAYSKIYYENIISIIENIENMIFSKYKSIYDVCINKIKFSFDSNETLIRICINISDEQQYSVILNRDNVIVLYNYLVNYIKTFNKIQNFDFNKKFVYVEVRYCDVYSSKFYSYISENKNIKPWDIVYVDRAGTKCLAVVVNKSEYYYEKVPYPVLETKRVIKIVTRSQEYKNV